MGGAERIVSVVDIRSVRHLATAITGGELSYTLARAPSELTVMSIIGWVAVAQRHRRATILAALVTTFAGVGLLLNQPERTSLAWVGIPLVAGGTAMLVGIVWPAGTRLPEAPPSLASSLIRHATLNGKLDRLFPMIGVMILTADLVYNLKLSASPALQTEDTIAILGACVFLGYGFVPPRFSRERDFVLTFVIALNAILVVPLLLARAWEANFERSVDFYSWVALAPQTSAVLRLVGVDNTIHPVAGATAPGLTFTPQHLGVQVTVVITTACSGIYSFGIFASAFVAFVLTEFQRPARRVWLLLGLGMATAYVANVLRMVIIVLVGYYTDTAGTDLQNMLIAHSYAGWLIFLAWIALFWALLFRLLPIPSVTRDAKPSLTHSPRQQSRCGICAGALTPIAAAIRCTCGSVHHETCLSRTQQCPSCGRPAGIDHPSTPVSA